MGLGGHKVQGSGLRIERLEHGRYWQVKRKVRVIENLHGKPFANALSLGQSVREMAGENLEKVGDSLTAVVGIQHLQPGALVRPLTIKFRTDAEQDAKVNNTEAGTSRPEAAPAARNASKFLQNRRSGQR